MDVKAVRLGFCHVRFRKYTHWERKKPGFTFSIKLKTNSKIFKVISWSMMLPGKFVQKHLPLYKIIISWVSAWKLCYNACSLINVNAFNAFKQLLSSVLRDNCSEYFYKSLSKRFNQISLGGGFADFLRAFIS